MIALLGQHSGNRNSDRSDSDSTIITAFEEARLKLGVRQRVQLLIHPDRTIPVIWGIVRFRMLLPEAARQWSRDQLRSVLLHELAHIKRRDTLVQLLTQVACALHWFNPLVWCAAWRLHVERERACDDLVLAQGVRASAYAEHLLNVATKLSVARWTSASGLAMASRSPLERRLQAILSDRLNRRKVSVAFAMIGLLVGTSIAIPIAMLRASQSTNPVTEDSAMDPEPKDKHSQALFAQWKTSARSDGKIPGGRIGEMAASLRTYMDLNAGSDVATQCEAVFKKCDALHDWTPADAAALLDEIETVAPSRSEWALRTNIERQIHPGKPLPDELKDAPWGSPVDFLEASSVAVRGLRMAWLLENGEGSPSLHPDLARPLESVMKSRILFHNTSTKTVCFATANWIQSGMHSAKDANGKNIPVWATERLGIRTRMVFRLAPGEYAEVEGHGIGIGSHENASEKSVRVVGAWIEAKQGDEVTFTSGKLFVSFQTWQNNEGRKDSETVWNELIATRVAQEGPWPANIVDRAILLKRIYEDLWSLPPNDESKVDFEHDESPDALAKLTARLQAAGRSMHFAGELSGGETKFRVMAPADKPLGKNRKVPEDK